MRLLKKKIEKGRRLQISKALEQHRSSFPEVDTHYDTNDELKISKSAQHRNRVSGAPKMKYSNRCLKNVAKNYGRAICNFIASDLADPYLIQEVEKAPVDIKEFKYHINEKKNKLDGIDQFRDMLLIQPEDDQRTITYKKLFQKLSEIFIKFFSVNWICSGRLNYKMEYIKVRYKVLRRVRNPELFTYVR
jgi:hypothetical protein